MGLGKKVLLLLILKLQRIFDMVLESNSKQRALRLFINVLNLQAIAKRLTVHGAVVGLGGQKWISPKKVNYLI